MARFYRAGSLHRLAGLRAAAEGLGLEVVPLLAVARAAREHGLLVLFDLVLPELLEGLRVVDDLAVPTGGLAPWHRLGSVRSQSDRPTACRTEDATGIKRLGLFSSSSFSSFT